MWDEAARARCLECREAGARGHDACQVASRILFQERKILATAQAVQPGDTILAQCSPNAVAAWPTHGTRWRPPPGPAAPDMATAEWRVERCGMCHGWRRSLVAQAYHGPMTGIWASTPGVDDTWATKPVITMDGSYHQETGGAAALLWDTDLPGQRKWRAHTTHITPCSGPLQAEAEAVRLATTLAIRHH